MWLHKISLPRGQFVIYNCVTLFPTSTNGTTDNPHNSTLTDSSFSPVQRTSSSLNPLLTPVIAESPGVSGIYLCLVPSCPKGFPSPQPPWDWFPADIPFQGSVRWENGTLFSLVLALVLCSNLSHEHKSRTTWVPLCYNLIRNYPLTATPTSVWNHSFPSGLSPVHQGDIDTEQPWWGLGQSWYLPGLGVGGKTQRYSGF